MCPCATLRQRALTGRRRLLRLAALVGLLLSSGLVGCRVEVARNPPPRAASVGHKALFRASCQAPVEATCVEYSEEAFVLGEALVKAGCIELRGIFGSARCPGERALGSCALRGSTRYYYPGGTPSFTRESAHAECTERYSGKWLASSG